MDIEIKKKNILRKNVVWIFIKRNSTNVFLKRFPPKMLFFCSNFLIKRKTLEPIDYMFFNTFYLTDVFLGTFFDQTEEIRTYIDYMFFNTFYPTDVFLGTFFDQTEEIWTYRRHVFETFFPKDVFLGTFFDQTEEIRTYRRHVFETFFPKDVFFCSNFLTKRKTLEPI